MLDARALFRDRQALLPGYTACLVNPLVHTNAGMLGDAAYARWLHWCNAARDVAQPPVLLGRYGPDTYLRGDRPCLLSDDMLVREQLALPPADPAHQRAAMRVRRPDAILVDPECLLACHPGCWVWGHWLIDTLPKILLAEGAYPGRFSFVVPEAISCPASVHPIARSILGSLAAYGIGHHRLLRLRHDALYRFASLFDVVDLRRAGLHAGALQALRRLPSPPASRGRHKLTAALRAAGQTRAVANAAELAGVLRAHGASELDPLAASFLQQVQVFRDSDVIVGNLGSNLAAAIYARPGAGIVTLGPNGWYDDYFVGIFRRLGLHQADIRGVSWQRPDEPVAQAPHWIDAEHLDAGLHAAAAAVERPPGSGPLRVDGRAVARTLGPVVLRIAFGAAGNAGAYQATGFASPEPLGTWSIGPSCQLVVAGFSSAGTDLWLEIEGVGFIAAPHLVSRPFGVAVNGVELAQFDIDELTHLHVLVPEAVLRKSGDLVLDFHHPVCPSPQSMGVSNDTRPLGFMFERLALRRLSSD